MKRKIIKTLNIGIAIGIAVLFCLQAGAFLITQNDGTPELLGAPTNIMISSNADEDIHPRVSESPTGYAIIYEKKLGTFSKVAPFAYSTNGGDSFNDGPVWDSNDMYTTPSGIHESCDVDYNSQIDAFGVQMCDPIGDGATGIVGSIWIEGDFSNIETWQDSYTALGYDGSIYDSTVLNFEHFMASIFITDQFDYGLTQTNCVNYMDYPEFGDEGVGTSGSYYFDGQSIAHTAPAYTIESANGGGDHMYIVLQTNNSGSNNLITYKATSNKLEDLVLTGGGPGGMDQYADIEVWPFQGVLDTSEGNRMVKDPAIAASGNNVAVVYMATNPTFGDWDIRCGYNGGVIPPEENNPGDYYSWEYTELGASQTDDTNPAISTNGNIFTVAYVNGGNLFIVKSFDAGATWGDPEQINEVDGTVVAENRCIDICPSGIVWTDERDGDKDIYFAALPAPKVVIESVSGGFGASATIANIGGLDAQNVDWTIDLVGTVFIGGHAEGTISNLPAGGSESISLGFVLGIGAATLTVSAGGAVDSREVTVLLPFILGL